MVLPLEKRITAFDEFNRLLQLKFRRKEIVDKVTKDFGVSSATAYQWFRGGSPYGKRAGRITINKELFYIVGALLGDGYIYAWRKRYRVGLSVRDKSFAKRFAEKLSKVVKREVRFYHYSKKDLWFVNINNAELFFLFNKLRNDLSYLRQLLKVGNFSTNSLEFLQGFIDAEGCVKLVKEETRKTPKVVMDITNKNLDYLMLMAFLLEKTLRIKPHFYSQFDKRRNSTYHHLRFYKKADVKEILTEIKTIKNRNPKLVRRLLL
ncbi:MAG: LAGLIDADG family homing endonuclease [Candidatus Micrarchaeales archaeon]|jgi:hypothetical protein